MRTLAVRFFDLIGDIFTSRGIVVFLMTLTMGGMIFFSHTLFSAVYPASMQSWERNVGTWFIAIGWELFMVITGIHFYDRKNLTRNLSFCSGLIVLFCIEAFDLNAEFIVLVKRWFLGALFTYINYYYVELFKKIWVRRDELNESKALVVQLQSNVDELQRDLIECQSDLTKAQRLVKEYHSDLKELDTFQKRIRSELTCPHCKTEFEAFGSLHAHKGHCKQKPAK